MKLVIVGAAGLMLCACKSDDEVVRPAPPGQEPTSIRVIHSSPDAPGIDVYVSGVTSPLFENLRYGEASPYLEMAAGTYEIEVRPAGSDSDSDPIFVTDSVDLEQEARATMVAAGLWDGVVDQEAFRVLPLIEGFGEALAGQAMIRIVHASADAPPVAIDVGNDGSIELDDLVRFTASAESGIAVPAGEALQLGVLTSATHEPLTAFTTPELAEGSELFIVATGRFLNVLPRQDDGFMLLPVARDQALDFIRQNPIVFALHGSPDAPAVDVVAGQERLAENILFGQLSEFMQVPPGHHELGIFPTGAEPTGTPAAAATTPDLEAGERYLAIVAGFLDPVDEQEELQLIVVPEDFELDVDGSQLRFVHASPDAPAVNIGRVEDGLLIDTTMADDLSFSEIADVVTLAPGELSVGVAPAGEMTPLATFPVSLSPGDRTYAVAIGAIAPVDGQQGLTIALVQTSVFPWRTTLSAAP